MPDFREGQKRGHSEFLGLLVAPSAKNIGTLVPATLEIGGDDGLAILGRLRLLPRLAFALRP